MQQDTVNNQGLVYSLVVGISNFQPLIKFENQDIDEYQPDIGKYVRQWCREHNFKSGKLRLFADLNRIIPSFSIEDVLNEISNP